MPELVWDGKYDPDGTRHQPNLPVAALRTIEAGGASSGDAPQHPANQLIAGETWRVLPALLPDYAGQVNLIYIDPPFATGLDFTSSVTLRGTSQNITRIAYRDIWPDLDSYLRWMDETLVMLRALLAEDGALLLHCDWRAEGILRLLLDDIFGGENFRNAIVWSYRSGGASRRESLARKHDTILLYAKSPRFTIRPQIERQYLRKPFMGSRRDGQGRHYVDTLLRDVLEGEITCVGPDHSLLRYNVRPVLNLSRERLDYPTQKPLGLLRLLLTLTSDPDDLVLDCCCGSGATVLAAEDLHRRWIAADASPLAIHTTRKRLLALAAPCPFVVRRPILEGAAPIPGDAARLAIAVEQSGRSVCVRLRGYTPPHGSILEAVSWESGDSSEGLRCLDGWSVDWEYDGATFHHRAHAARARSGARELPLALAHTFAAPGEYTLAVHAVDLAAHETIQTIRVTVE
ncbi:MAG TPA: DNA methyltransferase [Ktedonobacterales bacterium]